VATVVVVSEAVVAALDAISVYVVGLLSDDSSLSDSMPEGLVASLVSCSASPGSDEAVWSADGVIFESAVSAISTNWVE